MQWKADDQRNYRIRYQFVQILDPKHNLTWKAYFQNYLENENLRFSYIYLWITGTVSYFKTNSETLRTVMFKIPTIHLEYSVYETRHRIFVSVTPQKYQNWLKKRIYRIFILFSPSILRYNSGICIWPLHAGYKTSLLGRVCHRSWLTRQGWWNLHPWRFSRLGVRKEQPTSSNLGNSLSSTGRLD